MTRELLIDAVVIEVLGRRSHWPLNSDSPHYSLSFFRRFWPRARAQGYHTVSQKEGSQPNPLLNRLLQQAEQRAQQRHAKLKAYRPTLPFTHFVAGGRVDSKRSRH